jgi:hypothetical protein
MTPAQRRCWPNLLPDGSQGFTSDMTLRKQIETLLVFLDSYPWERLDL